MKKPKIVPSKDDSERRDHQFEIDFKAAFSKSSCLELQKLLEKELDPSYSEERRVQEMTEMMSEFTLTKNDKRADVTS